LEIRDEIEKRKKMMHYQIDDLSNNILQNLNNSHFKLSDKNKEIIKNDVTQLIQWLGDKKYYDRTSEELENTLENLKKRYGTLIVRGVLDKDVEVKTLNNNSGTSVYGNEEDENIELDEENNIINITEDENQNKLSEDELIETRELRKSLFDLCYSVFDVICNDGFAIDKNDRNDLKDFVDDTLLWIHVHDKPTKIEYKQKIDEINDACDKILNEYEKNNKQIFNESELMKKTDAKTELENLASTLKIMLDEKKTFLKSDQIMRLNIKLDEIFDVLYKEDTKSDELYNEKLQELNKFCDDLYNETNNINFTVNIINSSNIIIQDSTNGTDIETLIKMRQQDETNQLIIDTSGDVETVDIEDVLTY